jgi:hypothetical protein
MRRLFLILVLLPILAVGQIPGTIAIPTVGYFFDVDARTFRPILGIIGGSTLGDPIDIGHRFRQAFHFQITGTP